jgi:hypothetical protein
MKQHYNGPYALRELTDEVGPEAIRVQGTDVFVTDSEGLTDYYLLSGRELHLRSSERAIVEAVVRRLKRLLAG